jgi:hypothetical protein
MGIRSIAAGALMVAGLAAPAQAVVFASFTPAGTAKFIEYLSDPSGATLSSFGANNSVSAPVFFSFLIGPPSPAFEALFTLTASQPVPVAPSSGAFNVGGLTGSFSIIADSPVTFGASTGTNLLSGTFSLGSIGGVIGANTGTVDAASVSYTSDFLVFDNAGIGSFDWLLSSVTNVFGVTTSGGGPLRLRRFKASLSGEFSSEVAPALVPEPATWALLVLGFVLVGVSVRRRRSAVVA